MEKELLQQALNSILHGSTQVISEQDGYGNLSTREVRVNDLRVPLVNKLAEKLAQTPEFKAALERAFTSEIIKKLQDKMVAEVRYQDLPYDVKQKIERQMKDTGLVVQKYKVVAEVIENQD